jgi:hypothetical protein
MNRILDQIEKRSRDLIFVGLILACLLLAVGAIRSELQKREAMLIQGGARKVDLTKIRKQISEGDLSSRKALFYKKIRP